MCEEALPFKCLWCGLAVPPRKKSTEPRKFCSKLHGVMFWRKNNPQKVKASKRKTYDRVFKENGYITKVWPKQKELRDWITSLKSAPCPDCQTTYPPYCMDFDHREGVVKVAAVCGMVNKAYSRAEIEAEVAKCDVVCANCHRIRTHTRRQLKCQKKLQQDLQERDLKNVTTSVPS